MAQSSLSQWATYMYGMAALRLTQAESGSVVACDDEQPPSHEGELQASTPKLDFPMLQVLLSTPASRGLRPHFSNPTVTVCALTSFHDSEDPAIAL
jgi:hypothetical protein